MHVISLTKAWQLSRLGPNLIAATRRFSSPTGLQLGQELWIELVQQANFELQQLRLNGVELPIVDGGMRWKVSSLQPHNELRLEASIPIDQPFQRLTDMSPWFTMELQIAESP